MKILFISHDASRTGAPILLYNLVKLVESNLDINSSILINRPNYAILDKFNEFDCHISSEQTSFLRLPFLKKKYAIKYNKDRVKKALKGADVVFFNSITNGDLLPLIKKNYQGPIITYVHELEMASRFFTKPKDIKIVLNESNLFLVPCMAVKEFLVKEFSISESKIHQLDYYIPTFKLASQKLNNHDYFVIGGSGTIDWRKGPDLFLQVARIVFQKFPKAKIKFLWMGAYPSLELERLSYEIKKCNLEAQISFNLTSNNIESFFTSIDLFLLTSREDPYPLVVLEAAAAQVPSICFDGAGGAKEFIENSKGGIVVDFLDLASMADMILNFYQSRKELRDMGENAYNYLQKTHQNPEHLLNQFKKVISDVSKGL